MHEIGHLVGLMHSDALLHSDAVGGWFTDEPSTSGAGTGRIRRRIHTDDMQAARIARPDTTPNKHMTANYSFESALPYGTHPVSGSSYEVGWAHRTIGLSGANAFVVNGGAAVGSRYLAFTSGPTGTNTSIFQDFYFEPSAGSSNQSYMWSRPKHGGTYHRGQAATLAVWELDFSVAIAIGIPFSNTWQPRSVIDPNPSYSRRYRIEVYHSGPANGGYVDLDSISLSFPG